MTELLIVLVLVLLNGFFAMSEMAMVTARRAKLLEMGKRSRGARVAVKLSEHPEHFLSTVQVGITLIGVLTGYFGGEAIGLAIASALAGWFPSISHYAEPIGIGLAVFLITLMALIFGELVPKRFALTRAERIAARVAIPMRGLAMVAAPAVWLLSLTTRLVLRLLRVESFSTEKVTEEEIRLMLAESHEQGVLERDERVMMDRVMRLSDRDAESLMTPRTRIVWLDASLPMQDNLTTMREAPFSRYPVHRGSDQEVIGILESKNVIAHIDRKPFELFAKLRAPLFVADSTPALKLLEIFREEAAYMALVVDEYGDIQGMVTIKDMLDAVTGRIGTVVAQAGESAPVVMREDGSYLIDGGVLIEDLRDLLPVSEWPNDEEFDPDYHTLAGLAVARFGRIPKPGEFVDWMGWRFEGVDLDGARIDKLLLRRLEPADPESTVAEPA